MRCGEIVEGIHGVDLRIECDEDGRNLQVNDEPKYSTFVHLFSPDLLQSLTVQGKIDVSYVGFGSKGGYSHQKTDH